MFVYKYLQKHTLKILFPFDQQKCRVLDFSISNWTFNAKIKNAHNEICNKN